MLGRLPVVPRQPPPLLPGATADRAFKVFLLKLAVTVGAVLVLVELVQLPEWPTAVTSLLVLGLGVMAIVLALRWWLQVGERALAEIEAGYTTMVLTFGLLRSRPHRRWGQTAWRVPVGVSGHLGPARGRQCELRAGPVGAAARLVPLTSPAGRARALDRGSLEQPVRGGLKREPRVADAPAWRPATGRLR